MIVLPRQEVHVLAMDTLKLIELGARVCYKSEGSIKEGSAEKMVQMLIKRGHESQLEHGRMTLKMVTDRGVTHELVRHRMASYSQESTRYCNYSSEKFGANVTFILPWWASERAVFDEETQLFQIVDGSDEDKKLMEDWNAAMLSAEDTYLSMLKHKATPQLARDVLPNSLKTEIVMTANFREWRHFIKLRMSKEAHPQMRLLATAVYSLLGMEHPVLVADLETL